LDNLQQKDVIDCSYHPLSLDFRIRPAGHRAVTGLAYTPRFTSGSKTMSVSKSPYDASTIATLRQAMNEVISDRRFAERKFVTALEVAEHILSQASAGERDLSRLKQGVFEKLATAA